MTRETRLHCISAPAAAAVVAEATRPGDTTHTVRQDGEHVVIGYHDPRFPMDVAEWAHANGHAHDAQAAEVIVNVQLGW
ncbi:hypothetical protein AB0395_21880 [Streptosporangium sp. NPDC051023]|uniref:hypothetical protein n=1 Tax=Streptosporangium sp. NPDC051023 TaxID=3155410 RepID=UPI00344BBDD5